MSGNLNPVTDFIQAAYLLFGEDKTEGGLDLLNDCAHGKFFPRFKVIESAGGVSFPFGRKISGPEKTLSCLDREAAELCPQDFFVPPNMFKESQAKNVFLAERILNKAFTIQIAENVFGYRRD